MPNKDEIEKVLKTTKVIPLHTHNGTDSIRLLLKDVDTSSLTAHGVLVSEGSDPLVAVDPGTAGQVLTSNGSGTDPSFQAASSTSLYGGTGVDGALTLTSGTTQLSFAGKSVLVKNYTSISITGTANIQFTSAPTTGGIVILLSQGDITINSSAFPTIDLTQHGGQGGDAQADAASPFAAIQDGLIHAGKLGTDGTGFTGSGGGVVAGNPGVSGVATSGWAVLYRGRVVGPGMGGGGGGNGGRGTESFGGVGAPGGPGAASLVLEAGGNITLTSAFINLVGTNGTGGGGSGNGIASGGQGGSGGGGGGGGGGSVYLYAVGTITNGASINQAGGTGGAGGTVSTGGSGGTFAAGGGGGGGSGGAAVLNGGAAGGSTGNIGGSGGTGGRGITLIEQLV